jgi:hypothetical protein
VARPPWRCGPLVWLLAALVSPPPAHAQVFTGRIEVAVEDATRGVLPDAVVVISGPQKATSTTGSDGVARFLNLEPGTYEVKATAERFREYVDPEVPVAAGGTVSLTISLELAEFAEQVQVRADSPVIDRKKLRTSTTITADELQNVPSARDPWAIMQTVPGVVVDRVNVGGSTAVQGIYVSKGATFADGTYNVDGIPVTDMRTTGATLAYYDFDMFQEMNVTTGGSDLASSTGGVHVNLVLKSGSNVPRGSARVYFSSHDLQSNNMSSALADEVGSPNGRGNRTNQYADYGLETGGPLLKDRAWEWGSLGRTDARILAIDQTSNRTVTWNAAFKSQAQVGTRLRTGFTYFRGDKNAWGRGASKLRPPETTQDQDASASLYKAEANLVAGSRLFVTARASHLSAAWTLVPEGGMDKDVWMGGNGAYHGSYWSGGSSRPQQTAALDGSCFAGRHELKFGLSWRRAGANSTSQLSSASGHMILTRPSSGLNLVAEVDSPFTASYLAHYANAWIGDTIAFRSLTINLGLRLDRQDDGSRATSEAAVSGFERWLPAISRRAVPSAVVWMSSSPRVSAAWAPGSNGRTLVRAGYARFASQLPNGASSQLVQPRTARFAAVDGNGNGIADYEEINLQTPGAYTGFDINDPAQSTSINRIGGYGVPATHEVAVGFERQLFADLGVSATVTWRRMVDFNWTPHIGVARADYVVAGTLGGCGLPDGSCYNVPYYKAVVSDSATAQGTVLTVRNGYHQQFLGLEIAATRRMSRRWMARLGFSTNDHREWYDDANAAVADPTPMPGNLTVNGGLVATIAASPKSTVVVLPARYQLAANALYRAAAGLDMALVANVRQGYAQPWYRSLVATSDPLGTWKTVMLVTDLGRNRLPPVATCDVRVSWNPVKALGSRRGRLNLDVDVFNLFNSGTVLAREYDQRSTGFNQVLEIISPRIVRLGARVSF